jgi:Pyruvate/2-oxoacid:ferredoxin oxidoreductase gamma subunit
MIMVGKVIKETGVIPYENVERALKKVVSARHQDLAEANLKALALGYEF